MNNDQHDGNTPQPAGTREDGDVQETSGPAEKRPLSPAARRALAEAEARRKALDSQKAETEREIGGRGGADPARFGDWEINGRAIDF
ncbi:MULTISPECIES: DUF1674 domain-containing protein [Hoeflea]|jgi:hypothetical protein|uniref:DUF1674 domain-containing protein n=1 Tax=Hoeflea alexandrii TaxID=288436 RepID=A0ABT1CRH6_9HYPH|nr:MULTISPECIES: DUF1674 domain-containing protein [Hoeflea]MCO6408792.1 DUF1674 domain-containing protein [Hoeflea alexandrii]VVT31451.1 conserved hypothetical protein [Hoeflea sp. EC-HK425]